MRTIPALIAAAALVVGLTACSAPAAEPVETIIPADRTEYSTWGDQIDGLPDEMKAAYAVLSKDLDATILSTAGADVRVDSEDPGRVVVRVVTVDTDTLPAVSELRALLAVLDAFDGVEVTTWIIDAVASDGTWVQLGPVALDAGAPESFVNGFGDLEVTPADIAAFLD